MPDKLPFEPVNTPVQQIHDPLLQKQGVELYIKREDLNDPEIQGNKWLKLKPALNDARIKNFSHLLTFGGCYSNHIYATAAAGKRFGFKTTGIIRGPEPENYSPTLKFARKMGMTLHFINRALYRSIRTKKDQEEIAAEFQPVYIIPEGGSSSLAVDSCAEFINPLRHHYDIICTAVGTGGTIAGVIKGMDNCGRVIGFPALKGADFLYDDINTLLSDHKDKPVFTNWSLECDYHFGGYAKSSYELEAFILQFYKEYKIILEPVYTGKMLYGLFCLIRQGYFNGGTKILAIHTGGLQGLNGFPELKEKIYKIK